MIILFLCIVSCGVWVKHIMLESNFVNVCVVQGMLLADVCSREGSDSGLAEEDWRGSCSLKYC